MRFSSRLAAVTLGVIVLMPAMRASAQDSLARVKDLYASASYEESLAVASSLAANVPPSMQLELDRYRIFCLFALGRTSEATSLIEHSVGADPLYVPAADVAPRITAAFHEVRRRVLPEIVKRDYTEGRADFDRREFAGATAKLERAIRMLDDPDLARAGLGDLRVLANGFLDLIRLEAAKAAPAAPVAAAEPAPAPAPAVVVPAEPRVIPPVVIRQDVPAWHPADPHMLEGRAKATLKITINERGEVRSADLLQHIYPEYDVMLLRAALRWKYEPARLNGKPVEFVKILEIALKD